MVRYFHRGSVLILALIATAMIAILVGSMAAYFVNTARLANGFVVQRSVPRQVAMAALKNIEQIISNKSLSTTSKTSSSGNTTLVSVLSGGANGEDLDAFIKELEQEINAANFMNSGYWVKIDVERIENTNKLKITASVYPDEKKTSGTELAVLEMIVEFFSSTSYARTSMEIFDYVYFAHNSGRLNTSYIVANGEVGANGDFSVVGSAVNGYVKASGSISFSGSPKAWPRVTYMKKAAAEYANFYTPVRPTNKFQGTTNGIPYSVTWVGGYEPVVPQCPYTFTEKEPTAADSPGDAPAKPTLANPTYPEKPVYTEPVKGTYPSKPVKGTYPSKPSEPEAHSFIVKWWTYKGKRYNKESDAYAVYNADMAVYNAACKAIDDAYDAAMREYNSACAKIDADYEAAKAKAQAEYQAELANWNDVLIPQYNADKKAYDEAWAAYNVLKADYDKRLALYNQYLADKAKWEANYQAYRDSVKAWERARDNGYLLEDMTVAGYAEDEKKKLMLKPKQAAVTMPDVSSVSEYRQYCQQYPSKDPATGATFTGGRLYCENGYKVGSSVRHIVYSNDTQYVKRKGNFSGNWYDPYYMTSAEVTKDSKGNVIGEPILRTLATINITGGYNKDVLPFVSTDRYYYGNANWWANVEGTWIQDTERGSVILIGTADYPITITGPVYFDGDVIIRGFVTGQGAIYAGRNIHIIGDITYVNPPSWPHALDTELTKVDNAPDAVAARNSTKDLLSLIARGNIVVGDYTATSWTDGTMNSYLKVSATAKSKELNSKDSSLGYGSFNGDYTASDMSASDGGAMIVQSTEYDYYGKYDQGILYYTHYYYRMRPAAKSGSTAGRKFYQSKLGNEVISALKQSSKASAAESWRWPSSTFFRWLTGYYSSFDKAVAAISDIGDVTEIDAILFANHGILGVVGGSKSHKFTLNGALICRDEALLTSFEGRAKREGWTSPLPSAWLNWDLRIKSDSSEGLHTGVMEEDRLNSAGGVTNVVSSWRQVK